VTLGAPTRVDPRLFGPDAIAPETAAFNAALRERMAGAPAFWEHGREAGILPPSPRSDRAYTRHIDGPGGRLGLRVLAPDQPKGAYLHFHGGGFVLGSADGQDAMLERIADNTGLACVSVDYRLAPAHPYPAAWDDAEAAAVWLADHAKGEFGSDVLVIGGESAGATLAVPTLLRMRDRHSFTGFRAANLSFGTYDVSMTPSQTLLGADAVPLNTAAIRYCTDAFAPDVAGRRDPDLSSLYAELSGLPPALFTVGTLDPFLDDSLFMHARWIAAGNAAELAVYPGGTHGFIGFPTPIAVAATTKIDAFLRRAGEGSESS
jgi:acetyl esterase